MKTKLELEKLADEGFKVSKRLLKLEKLANAQGITVNKLLEDQREQSLNQFAELRKAIE